MDINQLKKQADDVNKINEELRLLKSDILRKFRVFNSLCSNLLFHLERAVKNKKMELFDEFSTFFQKNGFELITTKNDRIIAKYQDLTVTLEDDNPKEYEDEAIISLKVSSDNQFKGIVIKANNKDRDRLSWKNTLKYKNEFINNENYEKVISNINDINELNVLKEKLDGNISWYQSTTYEFENIKFVYSLYNSDKEYDTFEQLFKEL